MRRGFSMAGAEAVHRKSPSRFCFFIGRLKKKSRITPPLYYNDNMGLFYLVELGRFAGTGLSRLARLGLLCAAVACAGLPPSGPADAQVVIPPPRQGVGDLVIRNWSLGALHAEFSLRWTSGVTHIDILHRLCDSYGDHCSSWQNYGREISELRFPISGGGRLYIPRGGRWQSQVRYGVEVSNPEISTIN